MPKIDSMIDTMANAASFATKLSGATIAVDTLADTLSAFANPMNTYEAEVIASPCRPAMAGM